jgi:hypothetical protein
MLQVGATGTKIETEFGYEVIIKKLLELSKS